ncbi:hypothetical protein ACFVKB_46640 [Rhodococcus sp. NPDC127530]|uniref:hypothetical protein n=1 Tax=unclassified Rhodococcus (in: high G+C Gram-positive bacteria) TaxID=192944 RepID=UPI00363A5201
MMTKDPLVRSSKPRRGPGLAGLVAIAALAMTACHDGPGTHSIDEEEAPDALNSRGVEIPSTFRFGQMYESQVFSGANSYLGRYDGPQTAFANSIQLSAANSTFSPLQPIPCTDPAVAGPEWGILGFSCTQEMQLLVSVNPANSEFPTDKVTLLLISDGTRAHLFVNAAGH